MWLGRRGPSHASGGNCRFRRQLPPTQRGHGFAAATLSRIERDSFEGGNWRNRGDKRSRKQEKLTSKQVQRQTGVGSCVIDDDLARRRCLAKDPLLWRQEKKPTFLQGDCRQGLFPHGTRHDDRLLSTRRWWNPRL